METTEILILIQTIILFITGAIVFWYTVETNKIGKETQRQNIILAEQLLQIKKVNEFQLTKEISLTYPEIIINYFSEKESTAEFNCTNKGAAISEISISTHENYNVKIDSKSYIGCNQKFLIDFNNLPNPKPNELYFNIEFKTTIKQSEKLKYKIDKKLLQVTLVEK